MADSAARSASVTGSNTPPPDLSSMAKVVRKNGMMVSADTLARRSTKGMKSTAVIAAAPAIRPLRSLPVSARPCSDQSMLHWRNAIAESTGGPGPEAFLSEQSFQDHELM